MPSAAGGHKRAARDISPCQILASIVNGIVPCTCASTLSFINDNIVLLPFLSPFHFWVENNFVFILTLHEANAKLKGIPSILPCKQWTGSTEINLAVLSHTDLCATGNRQCEEGREMPGDVMGRNHISVFFFFFLGLWLATHSTQPLSPDPVTNSLSFFILGIVRRSVHTRVMLITGYEWEYSGKMMILLRYTLRTERKWRWLYMELLSHCDVHLQVM